VIKIVPKVAASSHGAKRVMEHTIATPPTE